MFLAAFVVREDSGRVDVRWPDGEVVPIGNRRALAAGRDQIDDMLESFRRGMPGLVPELEDVEAALRPLVESADGLVKKLLGDDIGLRVEIEQRLAAYRGWPDRPELGVPYVEVHGHDDFFPFELLPLFTDASDIPAFGNRADAEDVLARFLGYSAAVRRVPPRTTRNEPLHVGARGLPMQFLRFEMPGAVTEEMFFEGCRDRLLVEGPWPRPDIGKPHVAQALMRSLYDPGRRLDGGRFAPVPAQIQHFACHCDTQYDNADDFALVLGAGSGHKITLKEIYDGVLRYERRARWKASRPLVFLNACGASRVSAKDFRSFPNWFLSNKYRGFVGAETDIPDIVAAHYAARLYEELLQGARTLAEAVAIARVRLWRERGNPLGLLYVFYGDPFLKIDTFKEAGIR